MVQTILYLDLVTSKNVKDLGFQLEVWKLSEGCVNLKCRVTVLSWELPTKLFPLPMRNPSQTRRKSRNWPLSSDVSWVTLGFSFQRVTRRRHIMPHDWSKLYDVALWAFHRCYSCHHNVVTEQSLGSGVNTLIPWWKWYESKNWWKVEHSNWSDVEIIFIHRSIYTAVDYKESQGYSYSIHDWYPNFK